LNKQKGIPLLFVWFYFLYHSLEKKFNEEDLEDKMMNFEADDVEIAENEKHLTRREHVYQRKLIKQKARGKGLRNPFVFVFPFLDGLLTLPLSQS
jgi:hypothetical protein